MPENLIITSILAGLAAGVLATAIMTLYQLPFYRLWGLIGVLEWHENACITSWFIKEQPEELVHHGMVFHLTNGTLPAIVFSLISPFIFSWGPIVLLGIVYGLLLWVFTLAPIHRPITGVSITKNPLGWRPTIVSIVGHIIYGSVLALTIQYV